LMFVLLYVNVPSKHNVPSKCPPVQGGITSSHV